MLGEDLYQKAEKLLSEANRLSLGQLIRQIRGTLLKCNLNTMAKESNIHFTLLSRIEHDRVTPNPHQLHRIVNFFRENHPAEVPAELWKQLLDALWQKTGYTHEPILEDLKTFLNRLELRDTALSLLEYLRDLLKGLAQIEQDIQGRQWQMASSRLAGIQDSQDHFSARIQLEIKRRSSRIHYQLLRYDLFQQDIDLALQAAEQLGDWEAQGEILIRRGDFHRRKGEFEQARDCFQRSLQCYGRIHDHRGILGRAKCYRKRAVSYLLQGWPRRAQEELAQAFHALAGLHSPEEGIKCRQVQGWIYLQTGHWDKAINCYKEAVGLLEQSRVSMDLWGHAKAFRYLGDAYRIARQFDMAWDYYNRALGICARLREEKRNPGVIEAMIHLGLGRIALKRNQLNQAQHHMRWAMNFVQEVSVDSRLPEVQIELVELSWQLQQPGVVDMLQDAKEKLQSFKHWAYYAQCLTIEAGWVVEDAEQSPEPLPEDLQKVEELHDELIRLAEDTSKVRELYPDAPEGMKLIDEIPLLHYFIAIMETLRGRLSLQLGAPETGDAFRKALEAAHRFNEPFLKEVAAGIQHQLQGAMLISRLEQQARGIKDQLHQWLSGCEDHLLRSLANRFDG